MDSRDQRSDVGCQIHTFFASSATSALNHKFKQYQMLIVSCRDNVITIIG